MKDLNLSFINNLDEDDKILLNHVGDMVLSARNNYITKYTFFLNEKQCVLCETVLRSLSFDNYRFYGGYDDAQRRVLCVASQYESVDNGDYPIVALKIEYRSNDKLSHRDILGSLMSLNIARNTVGDIVVGEGSAVVFVYKSVSELILNNITKIGRVGVSISVAEDLSVNIVRSFQEITGTVASMRLDCVLALALHLSREKAREVISSKEVLVNYFRVKKSDFQLNENDEFSVRGFGKYRIASINGVSQKNRIHITINKYV